jgi:hypothetical protein
VDRADADKAAVRPAGRTDGANKRDEAGRRGVPDGRLPNWKRFGAIGRAHRRIGELGKRRRKGKVGALGGEGRGDLVVATLEAPEEAEEGGASGGMITLYSVFDVFWLAIVWCAVCAMKGCQKLEVYVWILGVTHTHTHTRGFRFIFFHFFLVRLVLTI